MGVYISNMEMPKRCGKCPLSLYQHSPCWENGGVVDWNNRPNWCPLVEIPPHGRLIEKNAVFELIRSFPNVDRQLPIEFMKALYELPTILEAEEGEG